MSIKQVPYSQMTGNRIIKKLNGTIITLTVDGIDVIKNSNVVNDEAYAKYIKGIEDEKEANKAAMYAAQDIKSEETPQVDRIEKVENDVKDINSKLDTLIGLMQK